MDFDANRFILDEHEKYYFGYSSTEVYDSFKSSITKCITGFLDGYRNALVEDNAEVDKELIEFQIEDLKALYLNACLGVLLEFKVVLQSIFSIPPNAPIYETERGTDYTEEQVKSLRKEVDELEQEYLKEKMFLEILKLEKNTLNKVKPILLETKISLSNLKSESADKNEKLRKLFKRHETYINGIALHTMSIEDTNELQMDFQL